MTIYESIRSNVWRSYAMMAVFAVFVVGLSYVIGQATGYGNALIPVAVILSVISAVGSYYFGDQMVLAMSGARPADRQRDFDFYTVAENLSIAAGLPMPKLYVIEDTAMNAFATGRDPKHAVVVATTGLLARLDRREIEGVIAHELSHVQNYDIRLMAVVAVLVGTVAYISDLFLRNLWWGGRRSRDSEREGNGIFFLVGIVLAIISPFLAMMIQMAVSRRREYLADASGALLTRYPEGLASALEKISSDKEVLEAASNATAHLYIANPFKGKEFGAWFSSLFDTHPPIADRIRRLREM
jgi:heat shock protein HtpX